MESYCQLTSFCNLAFICFCFFSNLSKQSPLIWLSCSPEPCILSNPRPDYLARNKVREATSTKNIVTFQLSCLVMLLWLINRCTYKSKFPMGIIVHSLRIRFNNCLCNSRLVLVDCKSSFVFMATIFIISLRSPSPTGDKGCTLSNIWSGFCLIFDNLQRSLSAILVCSDQPLLAAQWRLQTKLIKKLLKVQESLKLSNTFSNMGLRIQSYTTLLLGHH